MEVTIDLARAQKRHPHLVQAIHLTLNARLKRAKKPAAVLEEVEWGYSWAKAIGNKGGTLNNLHVALSGKLGRRTAFEPLGALDLRHATPRDLLPPEVMDIYTAKKPQITEDGVAHIAAFDYIDPRGRSRRALVLGAYRKKSDVIMALTVTVGDEIGASGHHILLRIDGDHLIWSGMMHHKAQERFEACAEGETFRYRQQPFQCLSKSEIQAVISGPPRHLSL